MRPVQIVIIVKACLLASQRNLVVIPPTPTNFCRHFEYSTSGHQSPTEFCARWHGQLNYKYRLTVSRLYIGDVIPTLLISELPARLLTNLPVVRNPGYDFSRKYRSWLLVIVTLLLVFATGSRVSPTPTILPFLNIVQMDTVVTDNFFVFVTWNLTAVPAPIVLRLCQMISS